MSSSLFQRMRSLLDGSEADESGQEPDQPTRVPTHLVTCPDCEKTFLVEEMDACPDCGTVVEETPTERDLGFW